MLQGVEAWVLPRVRRQNAAVPSEPLCNRACHYAHASIEDQDLATGEDVPKGKDLSH